MKTKFKISMWGLMAVLAVFFVACNEKEQGDVTKPVVRLLEPEDGDQLLIGDEHGVHFEMELSDDVMLKSYKINIHPNFDHHGHNLSKATATEDFNFNRAYDLSGMRNAQIHHHDIVIPANATPGDYHLMVWCTDAAGNQTQVVRNIVLSHDAPEHEHH